jgi:hypothetical protein
VPSSKRNPLTIKNATENFKVFLDAMIRVLLNTLQCEAAVNLMLERVLGKLDRFFWARTTIEIKLSIANIVDSIQLGYYKTVENGQ